MTSGVVLDSSALLAFIFNEPGAQLVVEHLGPQSMVSAVNWSEVIQKIAYKGKDSEQLGAWVLALGPRIEPLDRAAAHAAASLYPITADLGLSLGDRACLALAMRHKLQVLTADQTWANVPIPGIEVKLIR